MTVCHRQGCSGEIDEDGFCDTCGLEAPPAAASGTSSARTGSTGTAGTGWTVPSAATGSGSRGSSGRSSSRGLLGAGLVEVPRVAYRDPKEAVLAGPEVPEAKRFCSSCGAKVGRSRGESPGRVEGFCGRCGHRFSFTPKLGPGDLLHGQYEVLGCLAHGGLGWIYLALDHAVAGRWVVLKGLLDTGDADAMAAAVAERRFLAEVEHPNIVKIHNFVRHDDADSGTVGYIVMEYVGGRSLKELMKDLRSVEGPSACLPLEQAIAYALEMLPALGYLHAGGLLFCDFKPDNVIQTEEQLKLIDLGAVRRSDDYDSPIYGTIGYQAPEIASAGPSPASDLYTVGRALAVLTFPFDFQHANRESLPAQSDVDLLAEFDSYNRLLLRATAAKPEERFGSAEEMREQLTGVLREVLATRDGAARPSASVEFTPERKTFGVRAELADPEGEPPFEPAELPGVLPVPRVDGSDPAAFLATVTQDEPEESIVELRTAPQLTDEVRLRIARAHIELGELDTAEEELERLSTGAGRWSIAWHRGLIALARGKPQRAFEAFDTVYSAVPGEAAPKLAMAACAELMGDPGTADKYYRVVWRTDRSYLSAAFGLARVLLAQGKREESLDVLNSAPPTSSHYVAARLAAIRVALGAAESELTEQDLRGAADQLAALDLDAARQADYAAEILRAAFQWLGTRSAGAGGGTLLGNPLTEHGVRAGLEHSYRTMAKYARGTLDRIALVDRANQIRPRTWL
ncbi:tetratricopeptide repeat protein [Saccharomonospora sp. NPDC006951]